MASSVSGQNFLNLLFGGVQKGVNQFQRQQTQEGGLALQLQQMMARQADATQGRALQERGLHQGQQRIDISGKQLDATVNQNELLAGIRQQTADAQTKNAETMRIYREGMLALSGAGDSMPGVSRTALKNYADLLMIDPTMYVSVDKLPSGTAARVGFEPYVDAQGEKRWRKWTPFMRKMMNAVGRRFSFLGGLSSAEPVGPASPDGSGVDNRNPVEIQIDSLRAEALE